MGGGRKKQVIWSLHTQRIHFPEDLFLPIKTGLTNHHGATVLSDVSESVLASVVIMPFL